MATFRERPYSRGNFLVDLGTGETESAQAGFAEVILPEALIEAHEYRAGNERANEPRKVIGSASYGTITLKRGVIGSLDLYEWWNQARNGDTDAYRNVTIHLLSEDRQTTVLTWRLRNAFPVRHTFSELTANACEPAMEVLELAFERLELE
jgi:phage tail-like protein